MNSLKPVVVLMCSLSATPLAMASQLLPFPTVVDGDDDTSHNCVGSAVGPHLYVVDSSSQLGTINLDTHEIDVIGTMEVQLYDIAFREDGKLFGVNSDGLYEVNPQTAETTPVGARFGRGFGFGPGEMNALAFSPNGTLYAAALDSILYSIDLRSGAASQIGPIGFASQGDLIFDEIGDLYMSSTQYTLVKIDETTGAGKEIGPFGYGPVTGLARDNDNVVYGFSQSNIFTIDLTTGQGTQLLSYQGRGGLAQAFGGSFWEAPVVPEPSTAALGVMGLVFTIAHVKRRRAQSSNDHKKS